MPSTTVGTPNQPEIEERDAIAAGDSDGIYRGVDNEGAITEQTSPTMAVDVDTFRGTVSRRWARLATKTATSAVTDPNAAGNPGDLRRKDRVEWIQPTGLNINAGAESGSPSLPTASADSITLAEIHCRHSMTSVKDTDDASNGFIVDVRPFL